MVSEILFYANDAVHDPHFHESLSVIFIVRNIPVELLPCENFIVQVHHNFSSLLIVAARSGHNMFFVLL